MFASTPRNAAGERPSGTPSQHTTSSVPLGVEASLDSAVDLRLPVGRFTKQNSPRTRAFSRSYPTALKLIAVVNMNNGEIVQQFKYRCDMATRTSKPRTLTGTSAYLTAYPVTSLNLYPHHSLQHSWGGRVERACKRFGTYIIQYAPLWILVRHLRN